jgi:hypothetical protein
LGGLPLQPASDAAKYQVTYLARHPVRNWIQLCLFGEFTEQALYDVASELARAAHTRRDTRAPRLA